MYTLVQPACSTAPHQHKTWCAGWGGAGAASFSEHTCAELLSFLPAGKLPVKHPEIYQACNVMYKS